MFDANMRHIDKDKTFFCRIYQCDKNTSAYMEGIRKDDVIPCKMLTDGHNHDVSVEFHLEDKVIILDSDSDFYGLWAIYEGNIDGKSDFIRDASMVAAQKILKERKLNFLQGTV